MFNRSKPAIFCFTLATLILACRKTDINSNNQSTGLLYKVVYIDSTLPNPYDTVSSVEYFFDSKDRVTTMDWRFAYQTLQGFPQSYRFKLRRTSFLYNGTDSLPYMSNTIAYIKQNYTDPFIVDNTDFSTTLYQYDNIGRKISDTMTVFPPNWDKKLDYKFTYFPDRVVTNLVQYLPAYPIGRDTSKLTPGGFNIASSVQACFFGIDSRSFVSREMTYDQMLNPFNRLNISPTLYYAAPFNAVTFQGPEIYQPFYFNKNSFISQKLYSIYIAFYYPGTFPFLENEYSYSYSYTLDGYPSIGYFTNKKYLSGGGSTTTIIKALYTYK